MQAKSFRGMIIQIWNSCYKANQRIKSTLKQHLLELSQLTNDSRYTSILGETKEDILAQLDTMSSWCFRGVKANIKNASTGNPPLEPPKAKVC